MGAPSAHPIFSIPHTHLFNFGPHKNKSHLSSSPPPPQHGLPFFFVSAADGTNVVKVFESAILEARRFKESGGDVLSDMLDLLGAKDSQAK